jgi:hypothetical protein
MANAALNRNLEEAIATWGFIIATQWDTIIDLSCL